MTRTGGPFPIPDRELHETFLRASGPGGQNVNKVATAVQLRFDALHSPSLPDEVRVRLLKIAGNRLTRTGEIVIEARRHRTQERNRADAKARLFALIEKAAVPEKKRRPTGVPRAQKAKRLADKKRRGETKSQRRASRSDD